MHNLALSPSVISAVINDPSALGSPASLGISPSTANDILSNGYTHGFRTVFILHAVLNAVATITSVLMIKQKELTRGDEQKLKEEARNMYAKKKKHVGDPEKAATEAPAQGDGNTEVDMNEKSHAAT